MDDILIFAETESDLRRITRKVLWKCRKHDLFLKPEKCGFAKKKMDYLGFIISQGRIAMDPAKIEGLLDWPEPRTVRQLRLFLGFGNFYRKFIRGYSDLAKPLNNLLKKDTPWNFDEDCRKAFNLLKKKFTEEPVLMMPDPDRPFQIKADASKYASGAVLTQKRCERLPTPNLFPFKNLQSHGAKLPNLRPRNAGNHQSPQGMEALPPWIWPPGTHLYRPSKPPLLPIPPETK
jgi:hypothetical protein